jgi:4a-hydroxytetrahydrobiopterin dehydratase
VEKPRILSIEVIEEKLKNFPGWIYDEKSLNKNLKFKNFREAIAFVNRVAAVGEMCNHHPDILVHNYNQVKLSLNTHAAGGQVTDWDFELVERIESNEEVK